MSQENTLAMHNPELLKEWDYEKNNELGIYPDKITYGSKKKVHWRCSKDKRHVWDAIINKRSIDNTGCPICTNRKIVQGINDLASTHPNLLKEWDYEKNKIIGLEPEKVVSGSDKKAFWKCDKGHKWKTEIKDRARKNTSCLKCHEESIYFEKDFASNYPILLNEWNFKKNNLLKVYPDKISQYSNVSVYWKCEKNHEWKAQVKNRVVRGHGCKKCYIESLYGNSNDLKSNHPELLKEWDYTKNSNKGVFPDKVARASRIKAHWKCHNGHEWSTSIINRTYKKYGCPYCVFNNNSKIEKKIMSSLDIQSADIHTVYPWYSNCNIAKCDGVDQNKKVIVEYDGAYWHKDKMDTDISKTIALIDSGYSVIRIREKGLPSLSDSIDNNDYFEINDVYPYDGNREQEIDDIVQSVHEIMESLSEKLLVSA